MDDTKAQEFMAKLCMDQMIVAASLDGRKGGLLLVRKEVGIYSRTSNLDFIGIPVEGPEGDRWRLTGKYGEPTYRIIKTAHTIFYVISMLSPVCHG